MSSSEMAAFQRTFAGALARDSHVRERAVDPALARALAVHRNTAAKAAQDALAANYPVIRALFDDAAFGACAAAYTEVHPQSEPRLNAFGDCFDHWLRDYEPARGLPYLPDVARLERLVVEALFAADADPLDSAQMARRLATQTLPRLHPATRFARFESPAVSLWLAHQTPVQPNFDAVPWAAESVLITRPAGEVRVAFAAPGALAFLRACATDSDLDDAALAAAAAGADFSTLLPTLIEAGAFA